MATETYMTMRLVYYSMARDRGDCTKRGLIASLKQSHPDLERIIEAIAIIMLIILIIMVMMVATVMLAAALLRLIYLGA